MIKEYKDGSSFIEDNKALLDTNKNLSLFFYLDAKLLVKPDKDNYAFRVEDGKSQLLFLNVVPYCMMLFGDKDLLKEGLNHIYKNEYHYVGVLTSREIGDYAIEALKDYDKNLYLHLGMDFMEAKEIYEVDESLVTLPTLKDADEIHSMLQAFIKDCGILDTISKEDVIKSINNQRYRILRMDNKIVSMAVIAESDESSKRITDVYTRDEYRGKGLARIVVAACTNEIVRKGLVATLNVDIKNPISNHLYESIGYKKVFAHGEYRFK